MDTELVVGELEPFGEEVCLFGPPQALMHMPVHEVASRHAPYQSLYHQTPLGCCHAWLGLFISKHKGVLDKVETDPLAFSTFSIDEEHDVSTRVECGGMEAGMEHCPLVVPLVR